MGAVAAHAAEAAGGGRLPAPHDGDDEAYAVLLHIDHGDVEGELFSSSYAAFARWHQYDGGALAAAVYTSRHGAPVELKFYGLYPDMQRRDFRTWMVEHNFLEEDVAADDPELASTCGGWSSGPAAERRRAKEANKLQSSWNRLAARVRKESLDAVRADLGPEVELHPVDPEEGVKRRFLCSLASVEHKLSITYHGTKAKNFASIERFGLLKPGAKSIAVANGSAHGVGIYTARLGKPGLSRGFCDGGSSLFICAVCDTSEPIVTEPQEPAFVPSMDKVQTRFPKRPATTKKPGMLGRQNLHAKSDEVIHVGDAVVVFEEHFVVPIFRAVLPSQEQCGDREAEEEVVRGVLALRGEDDNLELRFRNHRQEDTAPPTWEPPQLVGRRRALLPEGGRPYVRVDGDGGHAGSVVWLSALPPQKVTGHMRATKRRIERREWKRGRMDERFDARAR